VKDEAQLRERLRQLADENRAWGYRMLCGRLKLEGWQVNHKRVHRLYREEKLALRPRDRKRIRGDKHGHPPDPVSVNEVWIMDFMSDALHNGRSIRTLNLLDAFTRQCHCIEVDTSLSGERVVRILQRLTLRHGKPARIQIDNGPEFRCKALEAWAEEEGVALYFIDPGKPNQNSRIESFNGRFRAECLDQEWFISLAEARRTIEDWRRSYNSKRPHSSLGYLPPNTWAKRHLEAINAAKSTSLPLPGNAILGIPPSTNREGRGALQPSPSGLN
jgi:putative transposase